MIKSVQIKTKGIKNVLSKISIPQAVSEYIWNGFDAGATKVELKVYEDPIGKTSGQRIDYFLMPLPENRHPIKKERGWYQKIGVFNARRE